MDELHSNMKKIYNIVFKVSNLNVTLKLGQCHQTSINVQCWVIIRIAKIWHHFISKDPFACNEKMRSKVKQPNETEQLPNWNWTETKQLQRWNSWCWQVWKIKILKLNNILGVQKDASLVCFWSASQWMRVMGTPRKKLVWNNCG